MLGGHPLGVTDGGPLARHPRGPARAGHLLDHGRTRISSHRKNRTKPSRNDGRCLRRYRRRYVIERTNAWLHGFRRLANRWEYYSFIYHGFGRLACTIIALGRL